MIGVVIRELTYLKILQPIAEEFARIGMPYILYHFDAPRGDKEYNRATSAGIKKSSSIIIEKANKVKAFKDDKELLNQLLHDKINKLVSIEIYMWAKGYISNLQKAGIKIYSLHYLSDSLFWNSNSKCITDVDKIYYATSYLRDVHLGFLNVPVNPNRDMLLGSPVFDRLETPKEQNVLVLLPNLRVDHVKTAFGNEDKFVNIIKKLSYNNNLIFKTRKKQWLPDKIKKFASEIVSDGDIMYPPIIADLFKKTHITVMFYSSGVYEAVYAGQYVVNITIPLARWNFNQNNLKEYFINSGLYNFDGVVESVSQDEVLKNDWQLSNKLVPESRQQWIDKYIGNFSNSTPEIVKDIISK